MMHGSAETTAYRLCWLLTGVTEKAVKPAVSGQELRPPRLRLLPDRCRSHTHIRLDSTSFPQPTAPPRHIFRKCLRVLFSHASYNKQAIQNVPSLNTAEAAHKKSLRACTAEGLCATPALFRFEHKYTSVSSNLTPRIESRKAFWNSSGRTDSNDGRAGVMGVSARGEGGNTDGTAGALPVKHPAKSQAGVVGGLTATEEMEGVGGAAEGLAAVGELSCGCIGSERNSRRGCTGGVWTCTGLLDAGGVVVIRMGLLGAGEGRTVVLNSCLRGTVGFSGEKPVFLFTVSANAVPGDSVLELTLSLSLDRAIFRCFCLFFFVLNASLFHAANDSSSETISPPGVIGRTLLPAVELSRA